MGLAKLLLPLLALLGLAAAEGGQPFPGWPYPASLRCPQLPFTGSSGSPAGADVSARIATASSSKVLPGLFFAPAGTYKVARSASVGKPAVMDAGATFDIAAGAVLTFTQPLQAGPQTLFVGAGGVAFKPGQTNIRPEWFGAAANGTADDAPAIRKAFQAASALGTDVLFAGGRTYGVGSTLVKPTFMRIMSEPGATLRALKPGLTGLVYSSGLHMRPDLLPSFLGFSTAIEHDATSMADSYTPFIGPAPGLPCQEGLRLNVDSLRIKFGTIQNCRTGVHVTTKRGARTFMQGVTVEGEAFIDTTGVAKQVWLFTAVDLGRPPYWDHGLYSLDKISPHPNASGFAVVRSNLPLGPLGLPFHTYEIGSLGPLPADGRLLDTPIWNSVLRVRPEAPFEDGQLDYVGGDFNNIILEGPATRWSQPLALSTQPDSLMPFLAANGLINTPWQNVLPVVTPGGAWKQGQTRRLYMYHQLVYDGQQLYLTVPKWGSQCIDGKLAVTALSDNSMRSSQIPGGSQYEVVVDVVACKDFTGPVTFPVVIGTASA